MKWKLANEEKRRQQIVVNSRGHEFIHSTFITTFNLKDYILMFVLNYHLRNSSVAYDAMIMKECFALIIIPWFQLLEGQKYNCNVQVMDTTFSWAGIKTDFYFAFFLMKWFYKVWNLFACETHVFGFGML